MVAERLEIVQNLPLDLNRELIRNPDSTCFVVATECSVPFHIGKGDLLICDTSIEPEDGKLCIAVIKNEWIGCRYRRTNTEEYLELHNGDRHPASEHYFNGDVFVSNIFGVITNIIQQIR